MPRPYNAPQNSGLQNATPANEKNIILKYFSWSTLNNYKSASDPPPDTLLSRFLATIDRNTLWVALAFYKTRVNHFRSHRL
jgi:hypothetical protein